MNPPDETTSYRIGLLEKQVGMLESKVDRMVWALVTLSLSIAASALVFVLTTASIK